MSYICQDCGSEYGDPELDAIPIICSECVETPSEDTFDNEEPFGDDSGFEEEGMD
jgi:DNA-directed RNA polymerase subunit RPC12/RpoP